MPGMLTWDPVNTYGQHWRCDRIGHGRAQGGHSEPVCEFIGGCVIVEEQARQVPVADDSGQLHHVELLGQAPDCLSAGVMEVQVGDLRRLHRAAPHDITGCRGQREDVLTTIRRLEALLNQ